MRQAAKAVELACALVREFYGDISEKLVSILLRKGRARFHELISFFRPRDKTQQPDLTEGQIRRALLVLVQHNLVDCHLVIDPNGKTEASREYHLYIARTDMITYILRRPRMVSYTREDAGPEGEAIATALVDCGRLRADLLLPAALQRLRLIAEKEERELGPDAEVLESLSNVFVIMIRSHLLERAPPCSLPPPAVEAHASTKPNKRGAKTNAFEHDMSARKGETAEYERKRYEVPVDFEEALAGVWGGPEAAAAAAAGRATEAAPLLKRRRVDDEDKILTRTSMTEIQWRLSVRTFNILFRHKECVRAVRDRLDNDAAAVIWQMLRNNLPFETEDRASRSVPQGERDVALDLERSYHEQQKKLRALRAMHGAAAKDEGEEGADGGPEHKEAQPELSDQELLAGEEIILPLLSSAEVSTKLVALQADNDTVTPIAQLNDDSFSYTVNMERIMDLRHLTIIQCIITNRFGSEGFRIMSCLLYKGILDQKQIAEYCMIPVKDARELLYRMMRSGFVRMLDIPKTADHAPSRAFFLWDVEMERIKDEIRSQILQTALNLLLRYRHELWQGRDLVALVSETAASGAQFTWSELQMAQIGGLQQRVGALVHAMMGLDTDLAVFADY